MHIKKNLKEGETVSDVERMRNFNVCIDPMSPTCPENTAQAKTAAINLLANLNFCLIQFSLLLILLGAHYSSVLLEMNSIYCLSILQHL